MHAETEHGCEGLQDTRKVIDDRCSSTYTQNHSSKYTHLSHKYALATPQCFSSVFFPNVNFSVSDQNVSEKVAEFSGSKKTQKLFFLLTPIIQLELI